jgi:hypothetical protein
LRSQAFDLQENEEENGFAPHLENKRNEMIVMATEHHNFSSFVKTKCAEILSVISSANFALDVTFLELPHLSPETMW